MADYDVLNLDTKVLGYTLAAKLQPDLREPLFERRQFERMMVGALHVDAVDGNTLVPTVL